MPKLLSVSEVKLEWTDLEKWQQVRQPESARRRSAGVHLSGVIRRVLVDLGKLEPREGDDEGQFPLRMAVGMAWENWLVGLMGKEFVWQPGEWERDGVFGTPDGITGPAEASHGYESTCLDEFKATWKSERTHGDVLKESLWMWQLAGNCYAFGLRYARLHVLWVNGNYSPPSPIYKRYLVEFSVQELEQIWQNVILKNRDKAEKEQRQNG